MKEDAPDARASAISVEDGPPLGEANLEEVRVSLRFCRGTISAFMRRSSGGSQVPSSKRETWRQAEALRRGGEGWAGEEHLHLLGGGAPTLESVERAELGYSLGDFHPLRRGIAFVVARGNPASRAWGETGGGVKTGRIQDFQKALPPFAEDIRVNLGVVLEEVGSSLSPSQRWGVAVASAASVRCRALLEAVLAEARAQVSDEVVEDALSAAAIMAMNVVYYGFQHMVHKEAYATRLPRLRMQRMAQPATNRADFELFSLAAAAIHGCHPCVVGHERALTSGEGGLIHDQVHDAIRVAATMHAAAVSFDAAEGR